MKLENQVCSLELAKKLKELGVKQKSLFCWVYQDDIERYELVYMPGHHWVSAFTASELGDMLPKDISSEVLNERFPFEKSREEAKDDDDMLQAEENIIDDLRSVFNELYEPENYIDGFGCGIRLNYGQGRNLYYFLNDDEWECSYQVFQIKADTEADARAKCLIYLIENDLIPPNQA